MMKIIIKRIFSFFTAISVLLIIFSAYTSVFSMESGESITDTSSMEIITEANWLLSCTTEDGVIQWYPDMGWTIPYFSSFAALGLLDAYRITFSSEYAVAVKNWIIWYANHQNFPDIYGLNGSIYDYVRRDNKWIATNDYDSADATAGLYLKTILKYYETTGDRSFLFKLKKNIDGAIECILSLQDSDGLTWAKPNYYEKYLMDNSEVYTGLLSAVRLYLALGNYKKAIRVNKSMKILQRGILSMWDNKSGAFRWAKDESGAFEKTDYHIWYPDCMEQIWPIYFGVIDTKSIHAKTVWEKINKIHYPNWINPNNLWENPQSGESLKYEYWNIMIAVAKMMGDKEKYERAVKLYRKMYLPAHNWPWDCACAGQRINSLILSFRTPPLITFHKSPMIDKLR